MERRTPLSRASALRRRRIVARHVYTGPSQRTRQTVRDRAEGTCEWPGCGRVGTDYHHRLNRKMGGRKGLRAAELNSAPWLLLACRHHHDRVTSASGDQLAEARDYGWVLFEHEDAREVPVQTARGLVLLDETGWSTFGEVAS